MRSSSEVLQAVRVHEGLPQAGGGVRLARLAGRSPTCCVSVARPIGFDAEVRVQVVAALDHDRRAVRGGGEGVGRKAGPLHADGGREPLAQSRGRCTCWRSHHRTSSVVVRPGVMTSLEKARAMSACTTLHQVLVRRQHLGEADREVLEGQVLGAHQSGSSTGPSAASSCSHSPTLRPSEKAWVWEMSIAMRGGLASPRRACAGAPTGPGPRARGSPRSGSRYTW